MENLLSFDSLNTVIFSDFVTDQAEAIYESLKGKYYVVPKGKDKNDFYFLQPNMTYEIYSSDPNCIISLILNCKFSILKISFSYSSPSHLLYLFPFA